MTKRSLTNEISRLSKTSGIRNISKQGEISKTNEISKISKWSDISKLVRPIKYIDIYVGLVSRAR